MSRSRRPTLEHRPAISLIVIGGPDPLVDAVKHVAIMTTNARVVATDIPSAATKVARTRPFAIILSEEIYAFDSAEFDALARDVKAELIAIPTDGVPQSRLQERLAPLILSAYRTHFAEEG